VYTDDLKQKALYLVVDWSMIGTRRAEPIRHEWADSAKAHHDSAKIAKITIRNDTLNKVYALKGTVARTINRYGLPSSQSKRRVVPITHVPVVDAEFEHAKLQLDDLAHALKQEWPQVLDDARERLGDLFSARDYPTVDEVPSLFTLTWRWLPIADTPDLLKAIAADVYEADLERAHQEVEADVATMRAALRGALVSIIASMRATLNKPDGRRRKFGKTFFRRLDQFLGMFDTKNLTGDVSMQALVSDLKRAAHGIDVELLKTDEAAQQALDTELSRVESVLEELSDEHLREIVM